MNSDEESEDEDFVVDGGHSESSGDDDYKAE